MKIYTLFFTPIINNYLSINVANIDQFAIIKDQFGCNYRPYVLIVGHDFLL